MSDEKKTNSTEEEQEPIEQLPIKEEFELREKRLKLVYKILYVAAALWGIVFLAYVSEFSSNPEQLLKTAPLYCFLLALSSVVILSIVSYAFRELQCMKISQKSTEFEKERADTTFVNIWNTFGIAAFISAVLMIVHLCLPAIVVNAYTIGVVLSFLTILKLVVEFRVKSVKVNLFVNVGANTIAAYGIFLISLIAIPVG